jgi:hypothetical protein
VVEFQIVCSGKKKALAPAHGRTVAARFEKAVYDTVENCPFDIELVPPSGESLLYGPVNAKLTPQPPEDHSRPRVNASDRLAPTGPVGRKHGQLVAEFRSGLQQGFQLAFGRQLVHVAESQQNTLPGLSVLVPVALDNLEILVFACTLFPEKHDHLKLLTSQDDGIFIFFQQQNPNYF